MIKEDYNSCVHHVGSEKGDQEEVESTKAKVGEVREENERLKLLLSKTLKDYNSLQTHLFHLLQRQAHDEPEYTHINDQEHDHPRVDISLRLGISDLEKRKGIAESEIGLKIEKKKDRSEEMLELGLGFGVADRKFDDDDDDDDESMRIRYLRNGNAAKTSPATIKLVDTTTIMMKNGDQDEEKCFEQHHQPQEPGLKRPRVCVRARCEGPTINDGCQWRKYGQKTAKGNPRPRAYYRCTMSSNCPVRKQVQRSSEDASILIMTYEGNHDHPLPVAATAMAAATSAAASILRSHSSTTTMSLDAGGGGCLSHFFPSHNTSISTSNSHPTITLDLAAAAAPRPNLYNVKFPNYPLPNSTSTSLSFSSFAPTDSLTRLRTTLADVAFDSRAGPNTSSLPFSSPFASSLYEKYHNK